MATNQVSHRGSHEHVLEFDNCRLPMLSFLARLMVAFAVIDDGFMPRGITVATMSVGRARRCF